MADSKLPKESVQKLIDNCPLHYIDMEDRQFKGMRLLACEPCGEISYSSPYYEFDSKAFSNDLLQRVEEGQVIVSGIPSEWINPREGRAKKYRYALELSPRGLSIDTPTSEISTSDRSFSKTVEEKCFNFKYDYNGQLKAHNTRYGVTF